MATQQRDHVRSTGPKASLILEGLAERRRRSLSLKDDRGWLEEITPDPASVLKRMTAAQLLYRVAAGRYLVAPRGTFSPSQAAPAELIAGLLLGGDYYIGYLSALIGHRLTDLHSSTVYAAVRQRAGFREGEAELPGGSSLRVVRLVDSRWPVDERELDRVRAIPDTRELIWRASLERTLVDALSRPELCGGMETVIGAWAQAKGREVDWELVCAVAERQGASMARRTAFVLRLLGLHAIAGQGFPSLTGHGANTPLDRSDSFGLDRDQMRRDRQTGVLVNVPESHLLGWAGASALP